MQLVSCMHPTHLIDRISCLHSLTAQACNDQTVQLLRYCQLENSHGLSLLSAGRAPTSVGFCLTLYLSCTTMMMESHAGVGLSMAGPTLISGGAGLHARSSSAEQMVAAAAALAATSAPLARLAMPTVSEGPSGVLQVSCRRWLSKSNHWLPFLSQYFQHTGVPALSCWACSVR